ncbi:MAG: hypothetical protein AB8G96_15330 [Phycisphaerales bacterium]
MSSQSGQSRRPRRPRRTAAACLATLAAATVLSGCAGGSRAAGPGDGWPEPIPLSTLFDPFADASTAGPGDAGAAYSLDRPLVPGTSVRVESEVAIDVRMMNAAQAEGRIAIESRLMPTNEGGFRGLTVARLIGRLDIDAVNADGTLERGRFIVADGALIRDGGLLAVLLEGDSVDINADGMSLSAWQTPSPAAAQASARQGGPLSNERTRLLQMCLTGPLRPMDWDGLVAWRDDARPPVSPRETGWIADANAARLLGLGGAGGLDPTDDVVTAGQSALRRPTAEERSNLGDGWVVETRTIAGPINDPRLRQAFGPALDGRGAMAAQHRWLAPNDPATGAASRESVTMSRFRLRDERGAMVGQRVERQRLRVTPLERPAGADADDPTDAGTAADADAANAASAASPNIIS